ncbi:TPA: hypothetical protein ACGUPM_002662 [Vibrio vulnificus]
MKVSLFVFGFCYVTYLLIEVSIPVMGEQMKPGHVCAWLASGEVVTTQQEDECERYLRKQKVIDQILSN